MPGSGTSIIRKVPAVSALSRVLMFSKIRVEVLRLFPIQSYCRPSGPLSFPSGLHRPSSELVAHLVIHRWGRSGAVRATHSSFVDKVVTFYNMRLPAQSKSKCLVGMQSLQIGGVFFLFSHKLFALLDIVTVRIGVVKQDPIIGVTSLGCKWRLSQCRSSPFYSLLGRRVGIVRRPLSPWFALSCRCSKQSFSFNLGTARGFR